MPYELLSVPLPLPFVATGQGLSCGKQRDSSSASRCLTPWFPSGCTIRTFRHNLDRLQIFALCLDLLRIYGMNIPSRSLLLGMAEHGLDHRWMHFIGSKKCSQAVP
jgi:hypothetical protein